MKFVLQHDHLYTLNFVPHEEVMGGLAAFADEHHITAAHITGLGAAEAVELAYYNLETKAYERTTITENLEILSLTGNIGKNAEGKTVVHLHGVFGRRDLSTLGGHMFSLTISGAGELHVHALKGTIHRAYDAATGLTLMCGVKG